MGVHDHQNVFMNCSNFRDRLINIDTIYDRVPYRLIQLQFVFEMTKSPRLKTSDTDWVRA